jgi:hypothetical protein
VEVVSEFGTIKYEAFYLGVASMVVAYIVLVFLGYASEGPNYEIRLDTRRPVMTARRILVGLGVRFAARMLRIGQFLLNPLFEASAEVGDWFADHASPEVRERIRSRFI